VIGRQRRRRGTRPPMRCGDAPTGGALRRPGMRPRRLGTLRDGDVFADRGGVAVRRRDRCRPTASMTPDRTTTRTARRPPRAPSPRERRSSGSKVTTRRSTPDEGAPAPAPPRHHRRQCAAMKRELAQARQLTVKSPSASSRLDTDLAEEFRPQRRQLGGTDITGCPRRRCALPAVAPEQFSSRRLSGPSCAKRPRNEANRRSTKRSLISGNT
jgi:hypothetical protein